MTNGASKKSFARFRLSIHRVHMIRRIVRPSHVLGQGVRPGVYSSALLTDALGLGERAGEVDVPTQGRTILQQLAALPTLMLAVFGGRVRHVCNETQNEVTSVLARIGRAIYSGSRGATPGEQRVMQHFVAVSHRYLPE